MKRNIQYKKESILSRERRHPCLQACDSKLKKRFFSSRLILVPALFLRASRSLQTTVLPFKLDAISFQSRLFTFSLFVILSVFQTSFAQTLTYGETAAENAADSVVTILLAGDGVSNAIGSGLVVRTDGYILTAYHLVKDAREIQVKLRNGETFDKAEIVSTDERRNIAILKIAASNLSIIPNGAIEETQVGSRVFVVANSNGQVWIGRDGLLSAVQLADNITGAGNGYRLLQFDTTTKENPCGGLLLDERGKTLGIITTTPNVKGQNIAVPLSSVLGLIRSVANNTAQSTTATYNPPTPKPTPVPIPQNSVLVPQRGVTPLSAKPPGSAALKPTTPYEIVKASKTIFIQSWTSNFEAFHLVNALNKKSQLGEWGLSLVDEVDLADLILTIDQVPLTWKFTFSISSQRAGITVATGSVIVWDGNLGADHMAERVIEKLKKVMTDGDKKGETPKVSQEDKDKKQNKDKKQEKESKQEKNL